MCKLTSGWWCIRPHYLAVWRLVSDGLVTCFLLAQCAGTNALNLILCSLCEELEQPRCTCGFISKRERTFWLWQTKRWGTARKWMNTAREVLLESDADDNNNNNNNRIQRCYLRIFTISSQHRELCPIRTLKWSGRNHVQITCNTSSTYHVQVSCYVPLGTKGQLSY